VSERRGRCSVSLFLPVAYFVACFYLWCGWKIFLPGSDTPFRASTGPIYGLANLYFQAGKLYYFSAPVLIGWGIGLVAARQRFKAVWPTVALVLIAWMGATSQIHASRTGVPRGLGHISMNFFILGSSSQAIADGVLHALVIFALTMLPYLIWRLQKAHSLSA